MKTLYSLIGPPAIGKSTWTKRFAPNASIISRDDVMEHVARENGFTYNDAYMAPPKDAVEGQVVVGMERFGKVVPSDLDWRPFDYEVLQGIHREVNAELQEMASHYAKSEEDVVIDMTNMNKESRALYMPMFSGHKKVAVVFNFKGDQLVTALKKNAEERAKELAKKGRHKTISGEVIDRMIASYEPPEASEGFDQIVMYDNSEYLLGIKEVRIEIRSIIREGLE